MGRTRGAVATHEVYAAGEERHRGGRAYYGPARRGESVRGKHNFGVVKVESSREFGRLRECAVGALKPGASTRVCTVSRHSVGVPATTVDAEGG